MRLLKGSLWVLTLVASAAAGETPSPRPEALQLQLGIRQVQEGLLTDAVVTLDAVILDLTPQAETRRSELVAALVHKGWALVGLAQENPAKECFRAALAQDPALKLSAGEYPDRVIRVFEAARTGKTGSVMDRPAGTAKKAGIGAVGIAAIAGGAALLAGGAAVAASGSESSDPAVPGKYYGAYQVRFTPLSTASPCYRNDGVWTIDGSGKLPAITLSMTGSSVGGGAAGPLTGTMQADGQFNVPQYSINGKTDGTTISGSWTESGCPVSFTGTRR